MYEFVIYVICMSTLILDDSYAQIHLISFFIVTNALLQFTQLYLEVVEENQQMYLPKLI